MVQNDSEKERLQKNLMQAVKHCSKLKVGNRLLDSSFKITPHNFWDFTENKYADGTHSFRMDSSIEITIENGDELMKFENPCDIHFDARIDGTDVEIEHGMVIAERNILPFKLEL